MSKKIDIHKISEEILLAVKIEKPTIGLESGLSELSIKCLFDELTNDSFKKAFWINIYNAFYQIARKSNQVSKKEIYRTKFIQIANVYLSLDDIEHGILRRYRLKHALGFMSNLLVNKTIRNLAVDTIDYRIHFALNCGAKSCPPIAFYNFSKIDIQLDMATQSFLEQETVFDDVNKIIHTTALLKWYRFDFGGSTGIKEIFQKQLNKDISNYKIRFNDYAWDDNLGNFVE